MTVTMAKVLIVEDDDVIAQGMAHHLRAAGFDPLVVARGEPGLARLRFERPGRLRARPHAARASTAGT